MIKSLLQPYSHQLRSLFWVALIGTYIAAVLPQEIAPTLGPLSDKWTHFLAFAVLTLLLRLSYRITAVQTTLFLFLYGILIEISQYFTPNRCAETLDVAADMIGVAIGLLLYMFLKKSIDVHR